MNILNAKPNESIERYIPGIRNLDNSHLYPDNVTKKTSARQLIKVMKFIIKNAFL